MKIERISDNELLIKNHSIDIKINGEKYDTIIGNYVCGNTYLYCTVDLYNSSYEWDIYIKKHLIEKYDINWSAISIHMNEYKTTLNNPRKLTRIKYPNTISIDMTEQQHIYWKIRQRNKTIDQILY
tara:strand:- start:3955 stop:4332 length:378 start_codon:yes stop_codon:yes gene_type:complete